jgi:hypothetical protein
LLVIALGSVGTGGEAQPKKTPVTVTVGAEASRLERFAGEQLAGFLESKHGKTHRFVVANRMPAEGEVIALGTPATSSLLSRLLGRNPLAEPGSFVVKAVRDEGREIGIVAGSDPRAVLHAVYALAEELGFGFYLSYDATALAGVDPEEPFDLGRWDLADRPLTGDRIVFNWHNFLSSCSTWDLPEWRHWIRQAARMRYTAVMVHAYGNNPMVCFTHNGQTKPVGYLSTTAKGRDWGTQHVNDCRRLHGAEGLFDVPSFGSKAAMVSEEERVSAAKSLMKQVFACAEDQGVDVVFALDVDTASSNPPNVILTLPESARLESAGHPLANPDAPEGFAYYRAQAESLLADYPQIDQLIIWFRRGGRTPWRRLTVDDFPMAWKEEYQKAVARRPEAAGLPDGPSMFAIARIVRAFRKALDAMGRDDVKLGIGTWGFAHMEAADAFMPQEVTFMALDWSVVFDTPEIGRQIRAISGNRPMVPIVWAHHDDRTYIGRCYTPYARFATRLRDYGASGFGIIHWTTRPLDLYFKSLSQQVWKRTEDQPLETTCREMAARTFGPAFRDSMGRYLQDWVTTAPQFGRETTDRFIDRPLEQPEAVIESAQRRRLMLERAAVDTPAMEYFKLLERFFIEFYRNETRLRQSIALMNRGDADAARQAIKSCDPESVIELYAQAARCGETTRGEKALVASMNLRWLPYFEAQRQALGLAPVRINFQPTQHDPLAQGAGHRTFFVDRSRQLWLGLGEQETGIPARTFPEPASDDGHEVTATGLESDGPVRLQLKNIIGGRLTPGVYRVRLWVRTPPKPRKGEDVLDVAIRGSKDSAPTTQEVDLYERSRNVGAPGGAGVEIGTEIRIDQGFLEVELTPRRGKVVLHGAILDAVDLDAPEPVVRKRAELERPIAGVTAGGSVSPQYSPQKAVDLDFRTRWAVEGSDQWVRFDLGRTASVSGVALAWFQGDRRRARFDVEVSNDASEWTEVFGGQSSGTTFGLEAIDVDGVEARYVRIVCHGNSENAWNSITEAAIFGE